ncbi:hypothetical protein HY256_07775, partial [Candidatus Sumerlaeota bacterium]|nr:hypothetical protein [Candidatus Sumerlaeota bacterium]
MLRFISSMGRIARIFSASLFILFMLILAGHSAAQTISFTSVPDGFDAGSIELPRPFAGALGVDADSDNIIYAAVGNYQDMNLARIDLNTGAVAIVAEGPFGGLGGIAPLTGGAIVLTDNASAAGGPPDDTILIARDLNRDGDFNDGGEITKLIDPILVNGSWSGAQARRVPKVRKSRLGAGSVMIQTADGAGNAELIVIDNPLRRPSFNLHRNPYFFGFDYNGGFDFDSRG